MNKKEVIVLGFGGNAIDFFDTISANYNIIGFIDDVKEKQGQNYKGIKVYDRSFLDKYPEAGVISLIGSEKTIHSRQRIINEFLIPEDRFYSAIHPRATVSESAKIGRDVVIMPGVVITSNALIEDHVFILANTVIHHDVKVGAFSLIGSNVTLAGNVQIGKSCYIGSCSSFKNDVQITDQCLVGMAANVLKSVNEKSVLIGNPAKVV